VRIQEYFGTKVGPIARTEVSYDQRGQSRGIATVIFRQPLAEKAVAEHNGITIDGKRLRVEVVYDAAHLPTAAPTKSLSDRVQPKKETATKKDKPKKVEPAKKERDGQTAGKEGRGKRGRAAGRPKKKTAEELDAEMTDYFGTGGQAAQATAGAAAAPAAAAVETTAMEAEEL